MRACYNEIFSLDDDFMSKVFEDKNCVEFLLQIILKRDDLKVTSVSSQYVIKNLQGRSVRLDILAVDRQNQIFLPHSLVTPSFLSLSTSSILPS